MAEASLSRTLNIDAQRVWLVLSDWGNTQWIEGIEKTEIFESDDNIVRRFHLQGLGSVEETLLSLNCVTNTLCYSISRCEIFPFDDYHGAFVITSISAGVCQIDWSCSFACSVKNEVQAQEKCIANVSGLLDKLGQYLSKYRVVQWATGKVGSSSLRAVIEHPGLDLVGLYVHSETKEGVDAGELCGLNPVGVVATRSLDEVIALKPDCVLYMQEGFNAEHVCALLGAGINVVTTRSECLNPDKMDQKLRQALEEACQRGKVSIHATGVSPGFITEVLPLALTSVSRRLDCLTIDEFADIPSSCSNEMILGVMGFGQPAGSEFSPYFLAASTDCFKHSLSTTAQSLSIPLDAIEVVGETATGNCDVLLEGDAKIEKGMVAAVRFTVAGLRHGKTVMRFRANWYCTRDINADWNLEESGWRVLVEGDAPFDIRIKMPLTGKSVPEQMGAYTANRAVNSVSTVCAAEPGICTVADFPQVVARLG
ncbi:MAG: SRPBCC family protein [Spongiibacteraceae bacterium]|nr:SRPBCC family protein [Spongiibacteraceae bacterium]